jgi:hypothetical protein
MAHAFPPRPARKQKRKPKPAVLRVNGASIETQPAKPRRARPKAPETV